MGRPSKPQNLKRRKWSVLSVTEEEQAEIKRHAAASGLSLSAYIARCALQRPVAPREDWRQIVRLQGRLIDLLETIASDMAQAGPSRDAGLALLALRRIEREIFVLRAGAPVMGDGHGDDRDDDLLDDARDDGPETVS